MADNLRSRKKPQQQPQEKRQEEDRSKSKRDEGPDLEPNLYVILTLIAAIALLSGSFLYYKIDNRDHGPFASWVNTKYPAIDRALNQPRGASKPLFGAAAQDVPAAGDLKLTEEELKAYDGTDPDKPIYLGINGTIFDVSASPAFYGPGGHYHHFVGKDATRAWITECWDEEEQFTWRMEGVEVMFMPKWMDEALEKIANGEEAEEMDVGAMPAEMMKNMAEKAMERFGKVSKKEKEKRRKQDVVEAEEKVQETLKHWVGFFAGNSKYKVAGTVVRDETRPEPPRPCKKAFEKRPLKGGKLEGVMGNAMAGMMGGKGAAEAAGAAGAGKGGGKKGEMPAHIKEKIAKEKKEKKEEEDDEDLGHEEL